MVLFCSCAPSPAGRAFGVTATLLALTTLLWF